MMKKNIQENVWYIAFAGFCALFVGIGLCRFSYTPLIPILIHQGWVNEAGAAYLGAINLIGYLFAAFFAQRAPKYFQAATLIKASLVVSTISLALCALDWGFIWLGIWRFMAGAAGAVLMIITPSVALKTIAIQYRGRAAGLIFTGIGLGIIVSGLLLPSLARLGIANAWFGAAVMAFIAMFISWTAFANSTSASNNISIASQTAAELSFSRNRNTVLLLTIAYISYGIGMVPHTLFLVDYVHRELQLDFIKSGMFWSVFGIGSVIGPLCVGFIADKIGIYESLASAFLLACAAILMILFNKFILFYILSSFLMGVLVTSIPTLLSSRILEIAGVILHPASWGKITLFCAISQAIAAYLMSYLLRQGTQYTFCFFAADLVFFVGLIAAAFARTKTYTENGARNLELTPD